MKVSFYPVALIALTSLVSGCASTYRPVSLNSLPSVATAPTEDVQINYKYDILGLAGNKKYAKKEAKKNIRVIGIEIKNATGRPITLREDIDLYSGNRKIFPLEPTFAKQQLKQIAPLYLLYSLIWVTIANCERDDCTIIPIPVGAIIGIGNMSVAASANKHLFEDLTRYDILDKVIEPGESVTGVICIAAESGQPIEIRVKQ